MTRVQRRWRHACGLALTVATSGLAHAGTVRGQLTMPSKLDDRADQQSEGLWRVENGVLPVVPKAIDPRECVVVFVPATQNREKEAKKEDTINAELRGLRLVPQVIVVPIGATLAIKNEDRIPHTLSVPAPDEGVLPARPTPAAAGRTDRQQRPGVFAIHDDELPHLHGWLIVTDGGGALRPDEHGAFHGEIPDGRYAMKVFVHGAYVVERTVDVGDKPLDIQVTLPSKGGHKDDPAATPEVAPIDAGPRDAGSAR